LLNECQSLATFSTEVWFEIAACVYPVPEILLRIYRLFSFPLFVNSSPWYILVVDCSASRQYGAFESETTWRQCVGPWV
jgi:hypothetical protein